MKAKLLILTITFICINTNAWSQTNVAITDSIKLKLFNDYMADMISKKIDTSFIDIELHTYKIMYSASCPYSEGIFPRAMQQDYITNSSGDSLFGNRQLIHSENQVQKYSAVYGCLENLIEINDSISYNIIEDSITHNFLINPSLNANSIWANNDLINRYNVKSYDNHKFFIVEQSFIFQHGGQTSWGTTFTYYLERLN
jgi:hypothetical protein